MGQVRWAGWTMAVATALVISGAGQVKADVESDKPAAILNYPDIDVNTYYGRDTVIRLTNTNSTDPIMVHCFYVDANSHCSGGPDSGRICNDDPGVCSGLSFCVPGWLEVDFRAVLTANQPIEWKASEGLADQARCDGGYKNGDLCRLNEPSDCPGGVCEGLPLPFGVCALNPLRTCNSDAECSPFPGGPCTQSNAGTRIPPVPEDPFVGELQCIAIDANGNPVPRNDLKGEAISERSRSDAFTVSSYNAIGIQATGASTAPSNELVLGGPDAEYNGCPNYLILNHFFDSASNPVPHSDARIFTEVTLVPCSTDYLRQIPGAAVVQYLVFNEFEQRFSTSKTVRCFDETFLCNIGTTQCSNSIFNVNVAGTLTGQTRMQPIGSGLLGVAREYHFTEGMDAGLQGAVLGRGVNLAAFNLHMQGQRETPDTIILP
jgi:hypothetical protein